MATLIAAMIRNIGKLVAAHARPRSRSKPRQVRPLFDTRAFRYTKASGKSAVGLVEKVSP